MTSLNRRQCRDCRQPLDRTQAWRCAACGARRMVESLRGHAPHLDGALCLGRWDIFDPPAPGEPDSDWEYRSSSAARICARCPVLDACHDWYVRLPSSQRPPGVCAARIPAPKRKPAS